MKKFLLFLIMLAAILNIAVLPVFGQEEPPLEVDYPEVPALETTPETTTTPVTKYVEYLFYFLVWGSGILALLALIYGGFKYITALGNPDKLRDAKDRIISAILGLAIVLGSYVILWQINPQYLTFNLPPLKPFINSIAPGVWACKSMPLGPKYPLDAWVLEQMYRTNGIPPMMSPEIALSIGRSTEYFLSKGLNIMSITDENNVTIRKAFEERIDELLAYINEVCYEVKTAGNVRDDFNDKIENLWFIPEITYPASPDDMIVIKPYGAAVFDDDDYKGLGNVFLEHMWPVISEPVVIYNYPTSKTRIEISSIKPFKFYTENEINWKVRLYVEKNYNEGFTNTDPYEEILPIPPFVEMPWDPYVGYIDGKFAPVPLSQNEMGFIISPESARIDGEALAILFKGAVISEWDGFEQEWRYEATPTILRKSGMNWVKINESDIKAGDVIQRGYYFHIFSDSDNNLLDNYTIVNWKRCPGYQASEEELENCPLTIFGSSGPVATVVTAPDCCAKAAADSMMIFSNIKTY